MARTDTHTIRQGAAVFIVGAAATAVAGGLVQSLVQPSTDISDDMWRYPWSNSGAFVAVSLLYIVFHLLVVVGLVAFGRSGVAGTSRTARSGVRLTVVGTLLLIAGEIASIPIRDARVDDTSAGIVGGVFALGVLLSAVGLLLTGKATLSARRWQDWRRYTPVVAGLWTTALLGIAATKALPAGVAVYGLCLLAMAVGLHTDPTPAGTARADEPGDAPDPARPVPRAMSGERRLASMPGDAHSAFNRTSSITRLPLLAALLVVSLALAPAAGASRPEREVVPAPDAMVFTGQCDFDVLAQIEGGEIDTTFFNTTGDPVKTIGVFPGQSLTVTNLETEETVTVVNAGSTQARARRDGSVEISITGHGPLQNEVVGGERGLWYLNGGRVVVTLDGEGNPESVTVLGNVVNLCERLAPAPAPAP